MPKLKARDKQTGEVFEFEWNGPNDPTEADIDRLRTQPSAARSFVQSMQDQGPVTAMVADPVAAVMDKGWTEALPTLGGAIGSFAGGKRTAVGAGLAALGGAAGEAAKSGIKGDPIVPGNLIKAAAIQGVGELLGRGVNAKGQSAARALYRANLKPSPNLAKEFPESAAQLLDDRVVISRRGQDRSQALIDDSVGQAGMAAQKADAGGALPIMGVEAAKYYDDILQRLGLRERAGMDVSSDIAKVADRRAGVIAQPASSVTDAVAIKREQQKLADAAFRAKERGAQALSVDDELNQATARGLKEATERRSRDLAAANDLTTRRVGGDQMLDAAVQRAGNYSPFRLQDLIGYGAGAAGANIAGGNPLAGVVAYGLVRALTTPRPASMIAIGANEMAKHIPLPQAVRAALLAKLGFDETQKPE